LALYASPQDEFGLILQEKFVPEKLSKIDQLTDEQPFDEKGARRYVARCSPSPLATRRQHVWIVSATAV
jgi:hypothetical protein